MAGPSGNYPEGSILELDKKQALDLVNGGYAQAHGSIIEDEPRVEKKQELKAKITPKKKR